MRTAILSDAHGNLPALQAVIDDAIRSHGVDEFWYLGDAVGYGPWPLQVWEELRGLPIPEGCWLAGNHEWGLLGKLPGLRQIQLEGQDPTDLGFYSRFAWPILESQQEALKNETGMLKHIGRLPSISSPRHGVYLAHGAFEADEKLSVVRYTEFPVWKLAGLEAIQEENLVTNLKPGAGGRPQLLAGGHTHKQAVWRWNVDKNGWDDFSLRGGISLQGIEHMPVFFNPGSIGFPRNGGGCAFYALIDWAQNWLELRRVGYSQESIIEEMEEMPYYRALLEEGFLPECRDQ